MDEKSIPRTCLVIGAEASNSCPASEWYSIRDYLSVQSKRRPMAQDAYPPESCQVHGQSSARNLYAGQSQTGGRSLFMHSATTQQAVVADALTDIGALWFMGLVNLTANAGHGSPLSDQSNAEHGIKGNYSQPYSISACVTTRAKANASTSRPVALPLIPATNLPAMATKNITVGSALGTVNTQFTEVPGLRWSKLLEPDENDYRLQWIELSKDVFPGSSVGAAVILPWSQTRPLRKTILCNLAAVWAPSSLVIETEGGGVSTTESTPLGNGISSLSAPIRKTRVPEAQLNPPSLHSFEPPYRLINISESWAQYLNPSIEHLNTSLINVLMQSDSAANKHLFASQILSMLTVNGLGRTGWGSSLQGEVKTKELDGERIVDGNYWVSGKGDVFNVDPTESQHWLTLRVDSTLEGFAYNTLTSPPRIAIAILMVYCVIVVGHSLYSGITGELPFLPSSGSPSPPKQYLASLPYLSRRCDDSPDRDNDLGVAFKLPPTSGFSVLDLTCVDISLPSRHLFQLLGYHRRGHGFGHQFDAHGRPSQYMCRYYRNSHLQASRPRPGFERRRRRRRTSRTCIWISRRPKDK